MSLAYRVMINLFCSIAIGCSIILISSCGSDSTNEILTGKIAGNSLVGKSWSLSNIEIDLGLVTPKACVADNNFTYFESGRYEVNEGATKCSAEAPPGLVGNWFIDDNDTEIIIQIGDSTRTWTIIEVENSIHRLASNFDGDTRIYTFKSN